MLIHWNLQQNLKCVVHWNTRKYMNWGKPKFHPTELNELKKKKLTKKKSQQLLTILAFLLIWAVGTLRGWVTLQARFQTAAVRTSELLGGACDATLFCQWTHRKSTINNKTCYSPQYWMLSRVKTTRSLGTIATYLLDLELVNLDHYPFFLRKNKKHHIVFIRQQVETFSGPERQWDGSWNTHYQLSWLPDDRVCCNSKFESLVISVAMSRHGNCTWALTKIMNKNKKMFFF